MERNSDKRLDPRILVEGAQSVLCFLAPYGKSAGGVAGFACGTDYHTVVKERLHAVAAEIKRQYPDFSGRCFVDSAPVLERYWAAKAGLGFIGLNHFLISPEFGLRTIIGVIICNVPYELFEPHAPLRADSCGECGRCVASCPTGALGETLDARRCIAYHTVESKELYEAKPVDYCGWIFGCEECLKVCPWNRECEPLPELETSREFLESAGREGWEKMAGEEFEERFRDSGLKRAGLEKIKNNLQ